VTEQALTGNALVIANADEDLLEAAVRQHFRLVYRIAYSVLRNHHDAEDATQETFIRVLRYRRKLQGIQDAKTWLARIAWRVAVDKDQKRPEISLSEEETSAAITELRSQLTSAEESVLGDEMAALFDSLISALPESLREAITLSSVQGLTPADVAQVLGTSESSVRSRIFRARQVLKGKLRALEDKHDSSKSK
jgi:RNA polymerase sigma-70 factor, ECF subfamily